MKENIIIDHIHQNVLGKINIPYIDVVVHKGHKEIFRYGASQKGDYTGKENLFMFSCTKPLTVACAMKLIEDGKLSLTDNVEDIIPSFKNIYMLNDKGEKITPPVKMTVKNLLTMTGGVTYSQDYFKVAETVEYNENNATEKIVDSFVKVPLAFCPGERFQYSFCHDIF